MSSEHSGGDDANKTQTVQDYLQANVHSGIAILCYGTSGVEIAMLIPSVPLIVGRSPVKGMVIDDRSLSREHARFVLDGEHVIVDDLGSKNGVFHHGRRVSRAEVEVGDELLLGGMHVRIQMLGPTGESLGLAGEGVFRRHIDDAISNARHSGGSCALLLVRAVDPFRSATARRAWIESIRRCVRSEDRLSWYGTDAVHVLLPNADVVAANQVGTAILAATAQSHTPACIGIAIYPQSGATVDVLVQRSVEATRRASVDKPIQLATHDTGEASAVVHDGLIVGTSMRDVVSTIKRVANAKIPVILNGETGTGKEVMARLIHEEGPRKSRRMVRVNCGAIPKDLVESTLFGHERGAFTGAVQQHKGVFEEADGGTLFLDEIGELPLPAQAALLRVLETGSISRVGSAREVPVDVRIVTATHRDLETMADNAAFRADLYYRLAGVVIEIPPLRTRKDEIEPLVQLFLRLANEAHGRTIAGLTSEAMLLMQSYSWPGNVRELRNAVERAVVITRDSLISADDLPARVRTAAAVRDAAPEPRAIAPSEPAPAREDVVQTDPARDKVQHYEAKLIRETLEAAGWNRAEAAAQLKMPVRTLSYRMKVLGIKKPAE